MEEPPMLGPTRVSRTQLEKDLKELYREKERDKQLLATLQSQMVKRRLEFLEMEEKWEKEMRFRIKMERMLLEAGIEVHITDESEEESGDEEEVASVQSSAQTNSPSTLSHATGGTHVRKRDTVSPLTVLDSDDDDVYAKLVSASSPLHSRSASRKSSPSLSVVTISTTSTSTAPPLNPPTPPSKPKVKVQSSSSINAKTQPASTSGPNHAYLSLPTFIIAQATLPVWVSRRALTRSFGASTSDKLWHSKDHSHRFLLPKLRSHPYAPRVPGEPGMILDLSMDGYRGGPRSVFYDKMCGGSMLWGYAGEYLSSDGGEGDVTHWRGLGAETKKSYASTILKATTPGSALDIRARVAFRKRNGRTPSCKELKVFTETIIRSSNKKGKQKASSNTDKIEDEGGEPISYDDIDEAFLNGHERLQIINLECINYDFDLAAEYIKAQKDYATYAAQPKAEYYPLVTSTINSSSTSEILNPNNDSTSNSSRILTSAPLRAYVELDARPKKRAKIAN